MYELELSRIFLYNWHRFSNHVLPVKGNLYLTGENGTGKSTILDALQLVLIGDLSQVHFNQAAQNERTRSSRNPATYVLGKTEGMFLRKTNTVAYIVLEFTDLTQGGSRCVGVCIEANAADNSHTRTYFLVSEPLDAELYAPDGKARSARELREAARAHTGFAIYGQGEIERYQADLLNRLGGLNELFFELLGQALPFKPIYDVHAFVEQMILPSVEIQLSSMQQAQHNVQTVEALARHVEEQITALRVVVAQQQQVSTLQKDLRLYEMVQNLLLAEEAKRAIVRLERAITTRERELTENAEKFDHAKRQIDEADQKYGEVFRRLVQHENKQQQNLLSEAIETDREQIQQVEERWQRLEQQLLSLRQRLGEILTNSLLRQGEQIVLAEALNLFQAMQKAEPLPASLPDLAASTAEQLHRTLDRLNEPYRETQNQITRFLTRQAEIQHEQDLLEAKSIRYPGEVERFRRLLEQRIGQSPRVVCEMLDVPEERWQRAVEAQLGNRRFALMVDPTFLAEALQLLEEGQVAHPFTGVRLIDVERLLQMAPTLPLEEGSLAAKVVTTDPAIRAYLNLTLGSIMTCESRDQLRSYRRAITPTLLTYHEASIYTLRAAQALVIGERGRQIRMAELAQEAKALATQVETVTQSMNAYANLLTDLQISDRLLTGIQPTLQEDLDLHSLRAKLQKHEEQLQSLDLTQVRTLEAEMEHWGSERERWGTIRDNLWKEREPLIGKKEGYEIEKRQEEAKLAVHQSVLDTYTQQQGPLWEEAQQLYASAGKRPLSEIQNEIHQKQDEFTSELNRQLRELIAIAERYNIHYHFRSRLDMVVQETAYRDELQRLEETELPYQQQLIANVRREMENQLRQDILHRLAEQFENINTRFWRINAILATRPFHDKKYRLHAKVSEKRRGYYDIIQASASLGEGSLYESLFYQEHQEICEQFFSLLLSTPQGKEESEQKRWIDYRSYFEYDILIEDLKKPEQKPISLAQTLRDRSGGETQTPFYVALAASFASLYRIGEKIRRPTIRLAIFDEAFSKMDQRYIDSTLEVFRQFQLQIITATPPERCLYLGPRMDTSLALTLKDDIVQIEPLRRYLDELDPDDLD